MTVSQEPQVVRLPDGRGLTFAEYVPRDGMPCIVLPGMPGSRLAPAWAFPASRLVPVSWHEHAFYGGSHVTKLMVQKRVAMSVAEAATTVG